MRIPSKIEFDFTTLGNGKIIGKATIHFKNKRLEPRELFKRSDSKGMEGILELFILLEHAARAFMIREALEEDRTK